MLQNKDKLKKYILAVSLTSILYISESLLPKPFPWMRIGLSNIVFMILLNEKKFFLRDIFAVLLFRNLIVSIIMGSFMSQFFIISLFSSGAAIIIMFIADRIFKEKLSFIGISVLGSCMNMFAQLTIGSLLVYNNLLLLGMLRYFLLYAFFSGLLTGWFANELSNRLLRLNNVVEK